MFAEDNDNQPRGGVAFGGKTIHVLQMRAKEKTKKIVS